MPMMRRLGMAFALAFLASLLAVSCAGGSQPTVVTGAASTTSTVPSRSGLTLLWFLDDDGAHIATEAREVALSPAGVLAALVEGPKAPGHKAPLTGRPQVLGASGTLQVVAPGTTPLGQQAVAATLLELDGVDKVEVNGAVVTVAPSAVAPITVISPPPGTRITEATVTISGTASVFEAAVSGRLLDGSGAVLARGFATASQGAPGRGNYKLGLAAPKVTADTPVTVEVYESSAKDGSITHSQKVPILLGRG